MLWCQVHQTLDYPTINKICAKVHRIITAVPDGQTDSQTNIMAMARQFVLRHFYCLIISRNVGLLWKIFSSFCHQFCVGRVFSSPGTVSSVISVLLLHMRLQLLLLLLLFFVCFVCCCGCY